MSENTPIAPADAVFGKAQLLSARRFASQDKDILSALLDEESSYTIEQAEQLITTFKLRTVS
ncbi:hypothetical protein [Cohnella sp. GCM10027633]|uniref:hypothetical protein n=1 Tax=unclassified Cohnella TaxID=2636738 RepID=UPI00362E46C7